MAKPEIVSWVEQNAPGIECGFYASMGQIAYSAAIGSAFTQQWYATGGFALVGGAAELAFNMAGCSTPPPAPDAGAGPSTGECWKVDGGSTLKIRSLSNPEYVANGYDQPVEQVLSVEPSQLSPGSPLGSSSLATFLLPNGTVVTQGSGAIAYDDAVWYLYTDDDHPCGGTADAPTHTPGQPIADPITHTDEDCEWTIQATDAYVDGAGKWHTYYVITANNDACGGPFAYWSSEDGPNFVPVIDPDGGPNPPPDADCCNDIFRKLDEIEKCACNEQPITPEGEWRTISFRSTETSPYGKSRLRKRLRYRSLSGNDLAAIVNHWKDFTWDAGPCRVRWTGGTWGTVEVWAATEPEGKRVIQHAAGEAGFDPFETGRWQVRTTSSTRLGVLGQMKVDTTGGYYWITSRDGSNNRPMVMQSSDTVSGFDTRNQKL